MIRFAATSEIRLRIQKCAGSACMRSCHSIVSLNGGIEIGTGITCSFSDFLNRRAMRSGTVAMRSEQATINGTLAK